MWLDRWVLEIRRNRRDSASTTRYLRCNFCGSVAPDWNPTTNGHLQSRLLRLASHRQRGHEPFLFGRKVRRHDFVLRVPASVLAELMLAS